MSAVKPCFTKALGNVRCRSFWLGGNINKGKLEITSFKWVSGLTVTYDLMMFLLGGKWLAQSPLHAFLHCIIPKFLMMKVADEVESAEAGLEPCWTNQAYTFLCLYAHFLGLGATASSIRGRLENTSVTITESPTSLSAHTRLQMNTKTVYALQTHGLTPWQLLSCGYLQAPSQLQSSSRLRPFGTL